jgi:TPR repeat protein
MSNPTMQKSLQKEAIKWLKKVASSGVSNGRQSGIEAQYILAEAFGKGMYGLSIDFGKSFSLYLQASKQNHSEATYRVAVCYELGAGTKKVRDLLTKYYCNSTHSQIYNRIIIDL